MDKPLQGAPYWLDLNDKGSFPDPIEAVQDPNGLLALGGDLSSERLCAAYKQGIFPWYSEGQPILWWSPDPRAVFDVNTFTPSKSLRKTLRNKAFEVRFDTHFIETMRYCAQPRRDEASTWIIEDMIDAYSELHRQGFAHSIETWLDGELVGGLYGVSLGKLFFGESMFSKVPDASKVALCYLVQQLRNWQFELIDCQVISEHLTRLGARAMPRDEFLAILKTNETEKNKQGLWTLSEEQSHALKQQLINSL